MATGLTLRSLAGIGWALGIGSARDTAFYWLNLTLYTPACLAMLVATVLVCRSAQAGDPGPAHC